MGAGRIEAPAKSAPLLICRLCAGILRQAHGTAKQQAGDAHSTPETPVHFAGVACRAFVLSALRLRVHERFGTGISEAFRHGVPARGCAGAR
ncbi:hypothetical protein D5047_03935 [Verminephrobacter eiseniae]|nr:hypothetical protein [Verminephrobacter eiseniae]